LRIDKDTYPKLKVTRGNMFLTTGHTIREPLPAVPSTCSTSGALDKGKSKQPFQTHVELLPEEALYLLERGSLQIWVRSPIAAAEEEAEADEWDEEIQGFRGAVEMSAMEAYGRFIGQDGLSLERYQVSLVALTPSCGGVCVEWLMEPRSLNV
jgi:tRNA-splicing endonuclease subunit Sen54